MMPVDKLHFVIMPALSSRNMPLTRREAEAFAQWAKFPPLLYSTEWDQGEFLKSASLPGNLNIGLDKCIDGLGGDPFQQGSEL